jgi:hypothetical protein
MFKLKRKKAYYSVRALRDGTIWLAVLTRKPSKKPRQKLQIDDDGIHNWYLDEDIPHGMTDWARSVRYGTVATSLNVKRIMREQIEPKLDEVLNRLSSIEERLKQMERDIG